MIDWLVKTAAINELSLNKKRESSINWLHDLDHQAVLDYDNLYNVELNDKRSMSIQVQCDNETSCSDDYRDDEEDDDHAEITTITTSTTPGNDARTLTCSPGTDTPISESKTKKPLMLEVVIDNANLIGSDEKQNIFYINRSVCSYLNSSTCSIYTII